MSESKIKLVEICDNARNNGRIDEPRIHWADEETVNCGFVFKMKRYEKYPASKVCGNCKFYNIQKV